MDNSTGKFLRALLGLFVLGVVAYVSFFGGYFTNNNQIVENENDAAELNTDLIKMGCLIGKLLK